MTSTVGRRALNIGFLDLAVDPKRPGTSVLSDVVWDMAGALLDRGHEVHVFGSYHTRAFPDDRVEVHNFNTPPMGYRNMAGTFMLAIGAFMASRRVRLDVLHTKEYISPPIFRLLGERRPIIVTVPGNIFARIASGENQYEWGVTEVLKLTARASARTCNRIIATSAGMRTWWLRTGSPAERTPQIPLGINPRRFNRVREARELIGLRRDNVHLLFVGRFSQEKGILDLLSALGELRNHPTFDRIITTLIGSGQQEALLRQRIAELGLAGTVRLQNWVAQSELPTWYSAADVVIMPSHNEPFGKVMIEAMACGTPVIASTTEGPCDHIRTCVNGYLFEKANVQALKDAIGHVLDDPDELKRVGDEGHAYVMRNLTWDRIAERLETQVYRPVLEERAPR